MNEIWVGHSGGDRFTIEIRGHHLSVDQPVEDGGEDTAPTPTELFVASLASCVAHYARRYLSRHGLAAEGLAVEASFTIASRPARVGRIDIRLHLPEDFPVERQAALLAVAGHCTVHNTLDASPDVSIGIAAVATAA